MVPKPYPDFYKVAPCEQFMSKSVGVQSHVYFIVMSVDPAKILEYSGTTAHLPPSKEFPMTLSHEDVDLNVSGIRETGTVLKKYIIFTIFS